MASAKCVCVFAIACLAAVSAFSISYTPQSRGRKLFGGYRIVPKVCQPTNPSRTKSDEPAICMFNYECSRRNGEVVGACMDGFLFGACCQLPPKGSQSSSSQDNSSPSTEELLNLHEIDHVPDIPILLNPDGTPVGISSSLGTTKIDTYSSLDNLKNPAGSYTKISTLSADSSTKRPSTADYNTGDWKENAEKPQISPQVDVSNMEADFPALLGQQEVLDDLRLPGLITHSDSNNDIQDHQETSAVNPVMTLLSPDQILQIADPVDQLPALFAQGLGQNNHSGADTVLLNKNGTLLAENNNPDEFFKPNPSNITSQHKVEDDSQKQSTIQQASWSFSNSQNDDTSPSQTTPVVQQYINLHKITETTSGLKYTTSAAGTTDGRTPTRTTIYAHSSSQKGDSESTMMKIDVTTPMSTTSDDDDDFVKVPTITYDVHSGNKKHDELDREEIAINHIISILNATTPSSPTKITQQMPHGSSSIQTWVSIDETSKPSVSRYPVSRPSTTTESFPYTFYKPGRPSTYYHYDTASTQIGGGSSSYATPSSSSGSSSFYSSRKPGVTPSTYGSSNGYDYSTRPSANPPAPTVIVLGPLGTEYTTVTTQKPASRRPTTGFIRPSLVTRLPSIGTTITHNISTVISTSSASTSNNHVIATNYISVNFQDNTSPKPNESVIVQAVEAESNGGNDSIVTKRPSTIWTTMSSWSGNPIFDVKPSQLGKNNNTVQTIVFKETTVSDKPTTTAPAMSTTNVPTPVSTVYDDDTPAPNDLNNFPPVRNPNLTQQENPTIVTQSNETGLPSNEILNEDEIPTPSFIEDDALTNKVDVFVNKIVESLQGNFQDLRDIVYNKKNTTAAAPPADTVTKKPPTRKPAKPTVKPTQTTKKPGTKKPTKPSGTPQKPGNSEKPAVRPTRPATSKPRPTSQRPTSLANPTTKKPPTKRPKPTKKITTTTTTTTTAPEAVEADDTESTEVSAETTEAIPEYRSKCGVRPLIKRGRIVGGKAATFGEWPWQVLVRESTWLGLLTKNKCGGVLLTNNYVLTAAHCSPGIFGTLVAVFGEFDLSGELESKRSVTRNVRRVIVHRDYVQSTFQSDIALLELEKPIQFDAHIVPICMPDDDADFTGRMATVTGWGRLKYNGGTPSVLQEVQVPIMENAVCQEMFRTGGQATKLILDSFLCAGYANGQKDSCEGDSGGPLMIERDDGRWVLVGTVSHGIKCATPYLPGVYMRTTHFKPWLHSVTGV